MAAELLGQARVSIQELYGLAGWLEENASQLAGVSFPVEAVTPAELKQISTLATPNQVLVVARIPEVIPAPQVICNHYSLFLDGIRDPGNLGTILRIADWFGIPFVGCSPDCVDLYNPKVIQASMGAFLRVQAGAFTLTELTGYCDPDLPVLGASMDGDDLFRRSLPGRGILVIGSEAKGISPAVSDMLTLRLRIPAPPGGGAESLNAAVAAGIFCAVLRNR